MAKHISEKPAQSLSDAVNQSADEQENDNKGDESVDIPDLSRLDDMSREQLLTLIRTVGGAIWGYALDDNEQKAEAARLKLYNMGMSATEVHKVVPALDKWFDRTAGKAPQSIAMKVEDAGLSKVSTERLLRLAAMMDMGEDMVIAPAS